MFKKIYLAFTLMAIVLPLVFSQTDGSTTENTADSTTDSPTGSTTASTTGTTTARTTDSTTKATSVQDKNKQPKDEKTLVSQFNDEDKLIDDSKLNATSMLAKLILTPFIYFVRAGLFIFEYVIYGLLFLMRIFVDLVLSSTGLKAIEGLVNPTLKGIPGIVRVVIHSISCLLAQLHYGPAFLKCPVKLVQQ